jgi:hypothetical protein
MTWFNHKIKNIEWINFDNYNEEEIISKIKNKMVFEEL